MNFNSRQTYVAAVAAWKVQYAELIQQIRQTKIDFKEAQREFSKQKYGSPDWYAVLRKVEGLRSQKASMKYQATDLIQERVAGKEEAHRQYLEEKAATV